MSSLSLPFAQQHRIYIANGKEYRGLPSSLRIESKIFKWRTFTYIHTNSNTCKKTNKNIFKIILVQPPLQLHASNPTVSRPYYKPALSSENPEFEAPLCIVWGEALSILITCCFQYRVIPCKLQLNIYNSFKSSKRDLVLRHNCNVGFAGFFLYIQTFAS